MDTFLHVPRTAVVVVWLIFTAGHVSIEALDSVWAWVCDPQLSLNSRLQSESLERPPHRGIYGFRRSGRKNAALLMCYVSRRKKTRLETAVRGTVSSRPFLLCPHSSYLCVSDPVAARRTSPPRIMKHKSCNCSLCTGWSACEACVEGRPGTVQPITCCLITAVGGVAVAACLSLRIA